MMKPIFPSSPEMLAKDNRKQLRKEFKERQLRRSTKEFNKKRKLSGLQFDQAKKDQDHRCAICENYLLSNRYTHKDHCHKSGKFRGLLCFNCNVALGHFRDNIEVLQRAIEYLKKHSS